MVPKARLLLLALVFPLLCLHMDVSSRELEYPKKRDPFAHCFMTLGGDALYVLSSPARMTCGDALKLFGLTAATLGCIALMDDPVDRGFVPAGKEMEVGDAFGPARRLARIGYVYDRVSPKYVLAGISASMLAGGIIFRDQKLIQTTRLMAESFLIASAFTAAGKGIFGRSRPYTGDGPCEFDVLEISGSIDYRSFPSGHTTTAFAMMTVIAKQYDQWWIKIPAYTLALSVGLQRIDSHYHWSSDVIVGGAIGYWVGSALVNRYKGKASNSRLRPYVGGGTVGVALSF